ncbi:MAG: hypothetical protein NUV51_00605 [Sulfuricaulis sp.]|nr:hypothetical protein [Sulfuricaulis sp.]
MQTFKSDQEAVAGLQAHSLSLLMDSLRNFSDELALVLLYLAFVLSEGISRNLVRSANAFNPVGLIAVSALLIWRAIERLIHPEAVLGLVPIVVGLGATANWGVARLQSLHDKLHEMKDTLHALGVGAAMPGKEQH